MASVDSIVENSAFAKKNEATFPILSDPGKKTLSDYGVLAESGYARRWTYYIDRQGIVVYIDKAVEPRTAGKTLLQNLVKLGVSTK